MISSGALTDYRNSEKEKVRASDLMELIPEGLEGNCLDVGARDGWFSILLAQKFQRVMALDLKKPEIDHSRVECVKGDVTNLEFDSSFFELVFCSEVLEHIYPPRQLTKACSELQRVASKYIIIGVPYKQDIRLGRTRCLECGKKNPPWGHVNRFDEARLKELFPLCSINKISFVGVNRECTNALSVVLMDLAGNPYGTYDQEEPCVHCGAKLSCPPPRNLFQKGMTRFAVILRDMQKGLYREHPNWIHVLFEK